MDMPLNAEVHCADGLCGQSKDVIVDRNTQAVTHLVVKAKHAPHTELLVPIDLVMETTPHRIRLRCTKDELAELQPFLRVEAVEEEIPRYVPFVMPAAVSETKWDAVRREAVLPGEIAVRQRAHVEATDGRIGRIDEFLVDPVTGQVTHLILREGHLWGKRDVTIPVSEIERIGDDTVHLKLDKQAIEALPAVPVRR
jgi:sporulation protein YlmC with PRC-barrel domain